MGCFAEKKKNIKNIFGFSKAFKWNGTLLPGINIVKAAIQLETSQSLKISFFYFIFTLHLFDTPRICAIFFFFQIRVGEIVFQKPFSHPQHNKYSNIKHLAIWIYGIIAKRRWYRLVYVYTAVQTASNNTHNISHRVVNIFFFHFRFLCYYGINKKNASSLNFLKF